MTRMLLRAWIAVKLLARSPVPVTCGFAMNDTGIDFGSGVPLWRSTW